MNICSCFAYLHVFTEALSGRSNSDTREATPKHRDKLGFLGLSFIRKRPSARLTQCAVVYTYLKFMGQFFLSFCHPRY